MTIFEITIFWFNIAPTYYWLMYWVGLLFSYYILKRAKILNEKELDNLIFISFLGIVLWWRIWYVLFYNLEYYLDNLNKVLKIWEWWMSFHWWFIWLVVSTILFTRFYKKNIFIIADKMAIWWTIWIWLWRIWNYLNWELFWFKYNWFLAMKVWENSYFPAPLLEAFLEWLLLFIILLVIEKKTKKSWIVFWSFMIWYWFFRIIAEFFRLPDSHIWYIFIEKITMWQILSIPLILIWILIIFKRKNENLN